MLHNIIKFKTPESLFELFKINRRKNVDIVTKYRPKTQKTENFFIYKAMKSYNKLPQELKEKNNFKKELKKYMLTVNDTFD